MTLRWIVTALGKDRTGIVAGVTKILYKLGCNLEDSAMTRLEGEFAIMLIFSSPAKATELSLRKAFAPLERQLTLVVHLKPLTKPETSTPRKTGSTYLISVYGADHPGIVFHVTEALAKTGINVTDVHTHRSAARPGSRKGRVGGTGPSLYLMLLEVEVPARVTPAALEQHLKRLGKTLGVEVSLRSSEADVL